MLLNSITSYKGIYLACGATDLRKGVDGLAHIVKEEFEIDPFGNYLFMFCNKARTRLKVLNWDKNGFCILYKRLDGEGAKFTWPCNTDKVRGVNLTQLKMLLNGLSVDPPKGFGEVKAREF